MLTETPRLPGTDGRKMSKSYGNFISLQRIGWMRFARRPRT